MSNLLDTVAENKAVWLPDASKIISMFVLASTIFGENVTSVASVFV